MSATSKQKRSRPLLPPVVADTTLRRLRMTPSYIFLIWRWGTWLYALIIILTFRPSFIAPETTNRGIVLLVITFVQSLIGTLYAPVFQFWLPNLPRIGVDHLPGLLAQLRRRRNTASQDDMTGERRPGISLNALVYVLDAIICGLVVYFSGPNGGSPFFGDGSPFYRYGMSVALAAAFAYGYRGALLAALGYDLFIILGIFMPAPGSPVGYVPNVVDIAGSLMDTPLIALVAAYLASLLANYARSRQREQDNVRRQRALVRVGETLIRGAGVVSSSRTSEHIQQLLKQSASQLRQGGHFQRLFIAFVDENSGNSENSDDTHSDASSYRLLYIESDVVADTRESVFKHVDTVDNRPLHHVLTVGNSYNTFKPGDDEQDTKNFGTAYLYLPFFKDGQVRLVLGAESVRQTPFGEKQQEFLTIAGTQLLVALDNIRLTEQMIALAATAERGRIAREIHDGVAQLVYMLSLNAETSAAQAHRLAGASEEDAELLAPLETRLETLVALSKQALWETRSYMFNLKPLMSGDMSLTQMLTNQVQEFQTISGLPTQLHVEGNDALIETYLHHRGDYPQVGAAIFRIVQEALTNAYKHANATRLDVWLRYSSHTVEVEIRDNGRGAVAHVANSDEARFYSGRGMRGMRERAEELAGTFEMKSTAGEGTCICVTIPV